MVILKREINELSDPRVRHLFDRDPSFNVYNNEFLNLAAGTPGPDLFKVCGDMMARASQHRWVIIVYFRFTHFI